MGEGNVFSLFTPGGGGGEYPIPAKVGTPLSKVGTLPCPRSIPPGQGRYPSAKIGPTPPSPIKDLLHAQAFSFTDRVFNITVSLIQPLYGEREGDEVLK